MGIKDKIILYKNIGETPLECMTCFKKAFPEYGEVPMTYAGRLDPMAEGLLLCLAGEECKKKDKYLALNKEYVFEVLVGFYTDSHDLLGLVTDEIMNTEDGNSGDVSHPRGGNGGDVPHPWNLRIGRFAQEYPAFSSKTVGGKQLHELAKSGLITDEDELPSREVEIFNFDKIGERKIKGDILLMEIIKRINLVKGDFRQEQIKDKWVEKLGDKAVTIFDILKFRVNCSSGTYIRALIRDMSKNNGIPMTVFSILRTKIGDFELSSNVVGKL